MVRWVMSFLAASNSKSVDNSLETITIGFHMLFPFTCFSIFQYLSQKQGTRLFLVLGSCFLPCQTLKIGQSQCDSGSWSYRYPMIWVPGCRVDAVFVKKERQTAFFKGKLFAPFENSHNGSVSKWIGFLVRRVGVTVLSHSTAPIRRSPRMAQLLSCRYPMILVPGYCVDAVFVTKAQQTAFLKGGCFLIWKLA